PRVGRDMVYLNERKLAVRLGCHRATVGCMVRELEDSHRLRRVRRKGRKGLLVQLPTPPRWLPPTRIAAVVDGASISGLGGPRDETFVCETVGVVGHPTSRSLGVPQKSLRTIAAPTSISTAPPISSLHISTAPPSW